MASSKKVRSILTSDSSDSDESDLVRDLQLKISDLEKANKQMTQEKARAELSFQEKINSFQNQIEGETISVN